MRRFRALKHKNEGRDHEETPEELGVADATVRERMKAVREVVWMLYMRALEKALSRS
jgi:hypothetical protein